MDTEKLGTSLILNYLSKFPVMVWDSSLRHRLQNPKKILEGADLKEGQTVLEVGCGSGFFTIPTAELIGESGHLIAMDPMANFVDEVRQKAQARGLTNIDVIRRDALRTELETASVDVVLLFGVVPFATLPLSRLLPEMHRVLRPAGTLALWQFPASAGVPSAIGRSGLFSYLGKRNSTRTFVRDDLRL